MAVLDLHQSTWRQQLDSFSRRHEGWLVSLRTVMPDGQVTTGARDVRLQGVVIGSPADDLLIMLGSSRDHLTHVVRKPATVKLDITAERAERALVIQSADGTTTTLEFRSPLRPEDVDGLPNFSDEQV
jgi:hypothetical protein